MDILENINIRFIIIEKFGKDVSTIICPYLFGNCHFCNKNIQEYDICQNCNEIFCKKCFQIPFQGLPKGILSIYKLFDFCCDCTTQMILNDN